MDEINYRSYFDSDGYTDLLQLSDAKLLTDDGCEFNINRIILAKDNSFFQGLFCGFNKDQKAFLIPGISGRCLNDILIYIYTEKSITFTDRNAIDFLTAAHYLLLPDLVMDVQKFIVRNVTVENCVPLLLLSSRLQLADIYNACFRFIQIHFREVIDCHKSLISECPIHILRQILKDRSLFNASEEDMWSIIVEWVIGDGLRWCYVPSLLKHLATGEIGENLARDILSHTIVKENHDCQDLNKLKTRDCSQTDLQFLLEFLEIESKYVIKTLYFRIPRKLYVVAKRCLRGGNEYTKIYITFDDQLDLYRKITELEYHPTTIIAIKNFLYIFPFAPHGCLKLDLKDGSLTEMDNIGICPRCTICKYKQKMYCHMSEILHLTTDLNYPFEFKVFDTEMDSWQTVQSFVAWSSVSEVISNKIFVIGSRKDPRGMIARAYNLETSKWCDFAPPNIFRYYCFTAVYHGQFFLMGGSTLKNNGEREIPEQSRDVEIFDPISGKWTEGQKIPVNYARPRAVVLNEKMYVYEEHVVNVNADVMRKNICVWNETEKNWQQISKSHQFNLDMYLFSEIEEEETIKDLWKGEPCLASAWQKCNFHNMDYFKF